MKSTFKYLALALLFAMATSAAYANSYKGTMTRLGTKMEYTFSGGVVTDKQLKGQGTTDMIVSVEGQVEAGSTVSASFKKLIDFRRNAQDVKLEMWVETTNGQKQVIDKKGKDAATASFKVPDNAKKVEVEMSYTGRMGRYYCFIDWEVVKEVNGKQSGQTITEEHEWYGIKIKYSISGGKLIERGNSVLGGYDFFLEASPGETITLSSTLLSKPENKFNNYYTQVGFSGCGSEDIHKEDPTSATLSYTIPKNAGITSFLLGSISLCSEYNDGNKTALASQSLRWDIVVNKDNNNNNTKNTPKSFNWDDVAGDDRCQHCHGQFSNYFFHIPQGGPAVTICNSDTKKTNKKIVDGLSVLYYLDWIITGDDESELVLDHCDQLGVMKILGKTKVLLQKRENGFDYWGLHSGRIVGRHVKQDNVPNPFFKMTNCSVQPNGAIYMLVDDHKTSRVFLFKGSIKARGKRDILTLKPGQVATFDENGNSKLQKFDLDAAAKKYGIKLSK